VGGENGISRGGLTLLGGSSPRGRGKRRMVLTTGWPVRLIPARAGKTITRTSSRSRRRAHPRAGGENGTLAVQDLSATGSSPRGRGKRGGKVGLPLGARLIPARAGKTTDRRRGKSQQPAHPRAGGKTKPKLWSASSTGAHPRAGGENSGDWWTIPIGRVSSPRGRGKLSGGWHPAP